MPVLFVGHGSPINVLDKENPFNTHYFMTWARFCRAETIL